MDKISRKHIPILDNLHLQAAFFSSHVAGVAAIGGAVSLAVSAFFGFDCLYPATITGFSLCAWAGSAISRTHQHEAWNHNFKKQLSSFFDQVARQRSVKENLKNVQIINWVEFHKWTPISCESTLPPPPKTGFFEAWSTVYTPRPRESVEVRAFTNGTILKYIATNSRTQAKTSGNIPLIGSIENTMSLFKTYFIVLKRDNSPVFSPSAHTLSDESGKFCARLLINGEDLIWNIYHKESQIVTSENELSFSYRCSSEAKEFFKEKKYTSLANRINCAKEFVLYKKPDSSTLYLEPIHASSGFNSEILVSKFKWGVTLIRYRGPSGNHAQIVVEGINDGFFPSDSVPIGKYFIFLADLMGGKVIDKIQTDIRDIGVILKDRFFLKYIERSKTWKRDCDPVKWMIHTITNEKDNPPHGFSILGRHSIFSSKTLVEDSCITWAINKLALIKIDLKEEKRPIFFTDTSHFTSLKPSEHDPQLDTLFFGLFPADSKII